MQIVKAARDDILDALIAAGGPFDPAALFLGIGSAVVDTGLDTVLADITQADATDYPKQAVTPWGTPYTLTDGRRVVDGPALQFVPPDNTSPQSIGVWILASALTGGTLKAFQVVDPPVLLETTDNSWTIVVRLTVDPDGRWDVSVAWNG